MTADRLAPFKGKSGKSSETSPFKVGSDMLNPLFKCTLIMNYTLKLFKNKPLKKYFFHYLKYVLNNGDFSKDFFRISPNIPQEIISPAQTVRVKYKYVPSRA